MESVLLGLVFIISDMNQGQGGKAKGVLLKNTAYMILVQLTLEANILDYKLLEEKTISYLFLYC